MHLIRDDTSSVGESEDLQVLLRVRNHCDCDCDYDNEDYDEEDFSGCSGVW